MENVLFHKIQRLRDEVEYIKANRERFLREMKLSPDVRKTAERSIFLCAEMVLDIADLMIVKKGRPKPVTYFLDRHLGAERQEAKVNPG